MQQVTKSKSVPAVHMEKHSYFRHERKYEITQFGCIELANRLKHVMQYDPHGDAEGRYLVRSLYFDNVFDTAMQEKLDGVDDRYKYRIRLYDGKTDYICFEKKQRKNGMSRKTSMVITKEQTQQIFVGDIEWMRDSGEPVLIEAYSDLRCGYRPKVIIEYLRQAFRYPHGNVRITSDMYIKKSTDLWSFFEKELPGVSVPLDDFAVLEVKYDGFLPMFIRDLLQGQHITQEAVSKYVLGRL